VIQDGVNGHLLEPGDIRGLAERVLHLLAHPDIAARMGAEGQSLTKEFDIREMVRHQEREYERLVLALGERKSLSPAQGYGTSGKH